MPDAGAALSLCVNQDRPAQGIGSYHSGIALKLRSVVNLRETAKSKALWEEIDDCRKPADLSLRAGRAPTFRHSGPTKSRGRCIDSLYRFSVTDLTAEIHIILHRMRGHFEALDLPILRSIFPSIMSSVKTPPFLNTPRLLSSDSRRLELLAVGLVSVLP